jgi:hypothetical protein
MNDFGSLEAFNALSEKFLDAWSSPVPSATVSLLVDRIESCALKLQEEGIGLPRYDEETLTFELESELEPHDHIPYVFLFTDRAQHILAVENATPIDKWKEVWEKDVLKERSEAMLLVDQKISEWVPPENTTIHALIKNRRIIDTGELLRTLMELVLPYNEVNEGPIKSTLKYKGKRMSTEELLILRDVAYWHHRGLAFIDLFGGHFHMKKEVKQSYEEKRELYSIHRSFYLAKDQRELLKWEFSHAWSQHMMPLTKPNQKPGVYVVPKKPFSARERLRELVADGSLKAPEVIWVPGRTAEERTRLGRLRRENERRWAILDSKIKSEPTVGAAPVLFEFDDDDDELPPPAIKSPAPAESATITDKAGKDTQQLVPSKQRGKNTKDAEDDDVLMEGKKRY